MFRTISTKFYQNRPGFVDDVTKTFGVFWGSQFQLLFTYETHGRYDKNILVCFFSSQCIYVTHKRSKFTGRL